METRSEQVTREDLLLFINACFAGTGQLEFYDIPGKGGAKAREATLAFLHAYVCGNYRRLFARTLATGINDFAKVRILHQLLVTGKETTNDFRAEENALIRAAIRSLPPQRAYKLFALLRKENINNRRTRAVIRDYTAARPDAVLDAVKYRGKVRAAVRHAHLKPLGETGMFLFGGDMRRLVFKTPLFESYRQAHFSKEAVYQLPYTVAEGFAMRHKIPRTTFLTNIAAQMTKGERERLMRSSTEVGMNLSVDLARMPLTRLALYLLALPLSERNERQEELDTALQESARRSLRRVPLLLPKGEIAAVLDASYSASGSEEKRRRPLAVALAAHYLLQSAAGDRYRSFWCGGGEFHNPVMLTARGSTNLADPLLDALETQPSLLLIVSDGYENDPPDGAQAMIRLWRNRLDNASKTVIVHLNPVFAADEYEPHALSPEVPTLGIRDAEEMGTPLAFARFAGTAKFAELEQYLREQSRLFLLTREN